MMMGSASRPIAFVLFGTLLVFLVVLQQCANVNGKPTWMSLERADPEEDNPAAAGEKPAADEKPADKKTGVPKESPKCNLTKNEILTACPQNLEPNCVPVDSERLVQAPYPGLLNCTIPAECRCITGRYRHSETNNCVLFNECPPKEPKAPKKGGPKGPKGNATELAGGDAGGKGEGGDAAPVKEGGASNGAPGGVSNGAPGGASNGAPGGAAPSANDASAANDSKKQQGKGEKKPSSDSAAPDAGTPAEAGSGGADGGSS